MWLDDQRDPAEWLPHISWWRGRDPEELQEWTWAKTASEAISLLETGDVSEGEGGTESSLGSPPSSDVSEEGHEGVCEAKGLLELTGTVLYLYLG